MIGILVLFFMAMTPHEDGVVEPVAPLVLELEQALPAEPQKAEVKKLPKVVIEIDAKAMVSAKFGKKTLAAFDATKKEKMKPLNDWLGKILAKEKVGVHVKVSGDALQQFVTDLLNVLAKQGVTEITFTDLVVGK